MKYSFILPIYNVEKYLEKCILSILNQTQKDFEVILVDDGSKDSSSKICDLYAKKDERIRVIHKQNGGLSDARNAGIEVAKGEYLLLIDSDDYVELNLLEEVDKIIQDDTTIDIVQFAHLSEVEGQEKKVCGTGQVKIITGEEILINYLKSQGVIHTAWNKVYKKTLFDKTRYPYGRLAEDIATTYKVLAAAKKIAVVDKTLYHYIIRSNSIMGTGSIKLRKDSLKGFIETLEYCQNLSCEFNRLASNWFMKIGLRLASLVIQMPNTSEKAMLL